MLQSMGWQRIGHNLATKQQHTLAREAQGVDLLSHFRGLQFSTRHKKSNRMSSFQNLGYNWSAFILIGWVIWGIKHFRCLWSCFYRWSIIGNEVTSCYPINLTSLPTVYTHDHNSLKVSSLRPIGFLLHSDHTRHKRETGRRRRDLWFEFSCCRPAVSDLSSFQLLWPICKTSIIMLLLLLLSCFSRVRLCATP